jgi:ketosteroid isomerase-like protein
MSANVELLKQALPPEVDLVEVLRSEDPVALFADPDLIDPELEVTFSGGAGGPPTEFQGIAGLLEGWLDWLEPWDSYVIRFEAAIDAGDKVVSFATVNARTSRYGVEVEHTPAAVWTVRDGRICAVYFFLERDDALKYAGLGAR